jgi:hypothetical protein
MTSRGKQKPRYGFDEIVVREGCHGPARAAKLAMPSRE